MLTLKLYIEITFFNEITFFTRKFLSAISNNILRAERNTLERGDCNNHFSYKQQSYSKNTL